ncbi:Subtilisin-like protease SBT5.4 [Thalictrum thalictroides]|uniref:Subtilisin-like protease SBT5.4 n=1 Tax=Thalictrum thalictroides TaxID=46969 RepID=A0A7J6WZP8_THATH|nr:Subtilisin-like protease SBT5.4 [Thalictrum thalictroides]
MGPIPSKWKGRCSDGEIDGSTCNRKLITMRKYYKNSVNETMRHQKNLFNATDEYGHGTHTLSTAGGRFVTGVNYNNMTRGTTKGGAPNARVASYKLAAAIGTLHAVKNGIVAVMAASNDGPAACAENVQPWVVTVGASTMDRQFTSYVELGNNQRFKNGIVAVMAAGNDGPAACAENVQPWVVTVGASTMDRQFTSYVELGNNQRFKAECLSPDWMNLVKKQYPLIRARDIFKVTFLEVYHNLCKTCIAQTCPDLDDEKAKGKIVLISTHDEIMCLMELKDYAAGVIVALPEAKFSMYAPLISTSDGKAISAYINSTKSPTAYITPVIVELNTKPAPIVSSYSCRGPNGITEEILKPDIIAPGTQVIAASPPEADDYHQAYIALTGTSMATPIVAGVVALLKAIHPEWTPAMIQSPIMTTASTTDNTNQPIKDFNEETATPFVMGAGLIQPNTAADPGFVTVRRIVKNVGTPGLYNVTVTEPEGIFADVHPKRLIFNKVGEKKTFKPTLKAKKAPVSKNYVFGKLVWSDVGHTVTNPIVVKGA